MNKYLVLSLIILSGLLLRLYHLGYHDLWYDEAFSIFLARNFRHIWNPPLFYAILHYWTKIFGESEFSIRFPALVFSTLSIPLIFVLAKKLFNYKAGLFTAIIMAISPFQLWYAQEARHYSIALFFGILSTYSLLMTLEDRKKYWFYFTLSSILGLYSNELYIFLFFTQLTLIIAKNQNFLKKDTIKFLILSLSFTSLFFLPAAVRYLTKFNFIRDGFWIPMPDIHSLIITFENFFFGYNLSQNLYLVGDIFIFILLIIAFKSNLNNKSAKHNLYICLLLFLLPIILIYFFSKLIVSIYIDRSLIFFSAYFYILLAVGIERLLRKKLSFLMLLPLCLLSVIAITNFYRDYMSTPFKHHIGTYIKKPVKPIIKFIDENASPEDIIGFSNHSTLPSFHLYSINKSRIYYEFFDPKLPNTDWQRPIQETPYCIPKQKIPLLKAERIWVIASDWWHDGGLDEQSQSVKEYLDNEMALELAKNICGTWIYLYVQNK